MKEQLPPAFDLSKVATGFLKHKDTRKAGQAIEHMLDAHSAHADMQFAYEIMVALNNDARQEDATGEPRYTSVERGALFSQAVIYYVRATQVSGSRRRSDLAGRLTGEQQAMHREMEQMRHEAFAHFDRSASYKGLAFANEKVVAVFGPQGMTLRSAIRRLVLNEQLYGDVLHQVEAMLAIIDTYKQERTEKAMAALRAASDGNPKVARDFQSYRFDAEDFFGNSEIARDFLTTRASMTQAATSGDDATILKRR